MVGAMVGPADGAPGCITLTCELHRRSHFPAVSMVEHATSRAPLSMGRPALLLLLICAVCVVSVPARPSLRPSSPDEFRKLLLWAQKAAERGDIEPPFPSAEQLNEVDKVWTRTHKKGYLQDADLIAAPRRPYVESSDFRHRRPESTSSSFQTSHSRPRFYPSQEVRQPPATESVPVTDIQPPVLPSTIPTEKRVIPKKIDHTRSKPISETLAYYTDDNPDSEKKLETLSQPSIVYVDDVADRDSLPGPEERAKPAENTSGDNKEEVADSEAGTSSISSAVRLANDDTLLPKNIPPVFGHSLFPEELTGASVSRLPSYEEYDRNDRYSHSFLHGFSGF